MNKFEKSYSSIDSHTYQFYRNSSLYSFWKLSLDITGHSSNDRTLEAGCGAGITVDFPNSIGIEISKSAKSLASESVNDRIIVGDILVYPFKTKFNVILDSHLAHCLSGVEEIAQYFKRCFDLLESGGHFLLEIMVQPRNLEVDAGFVFNIERSTIEKSGKVHRTVLGAREVEDLLLSFGVKIVYLRVDGNIKFIPYSHRSESLPTDPERMRVICLKE